MSQKILCQLQPFPLAHAGHQCRSSRVPARRGDRYRGLAARKQRRLWPGRHANGRCAFAKAARPSSLRPTERRLPLRQKLQSSRPAFRLVPRPSSTRTDEDRATTSPASCPVVYSFRHLVFPLSQPRAAAGSPQSRAPSRDRLRETARLRGVPASVEHRVSSMFYGRHPDPTSRPRPPRLLRACQQPRNFWHREQARRSVRPAPLSAAVPDAFPQSADHPANREWPAPVACRWPRHWRAVCRSPPQSRA